MLCVICYDIADDRRRARVARELEGWGLRVQDSVFECHLDHASLEQIKDELAPLIDPAADLLRYYTLCDKDRADIRTIGIDGVTRDVAYWLA